jgi:hypothetical protein
LKIPLSRIRNTPIITMKNPEEAVPDPAMKCDILIPRYTRKEPIARKTKPGMASNFLIFIFFFLLDPQFSSDIAASHLLYTGF